MRCKDVLQLNFDCYDFNEYRYPRVGIEILFPVSWDQSSRNQLLPDLLPKPHSWVTDFGGISFDYPNNLIFQIPAAWVLFLSLTGETAIQVVWIFIESENL